MYIIQSEWNFILLSTVKEVPVSNYSSVKKFPVDMKQSNAPLSPKDHNWKLS